MTATKTKPQAQANDTYRLDYQIECLPGRVGVTVTQKSGVVTSYHLTKKVFLGGVASVRITCATDPKRNYLVSITSTGWVFTCNCPDHKRTGKACKHMRLVEKMDSKKEFGI